MAWVMTCAGGVLATSTGLAQEPTARPAPVQVPMDSIAASDAVPNAYGTTGTTVVKIHATAFRSQSSGDKLEAFWNTGITYRSAGDWNNRLHAPVQLPAGAVVTAIGFDGYDVDFSTNISWGIYWVSANADNTTGSIGWYYSLQTEGYFSAESPVTPHTVDPDRYYFAMVELPKLGQDLRIKGMRITYQLQVSPAPATATFSDVPTTHWAFRYVEALAASGITAGCAPGLFCPGNPISRAEMAVFLADALGLYYPN